MYFFLFFPEYFSLSPFSPLFHHAALTHLDFYSLYFYAYKIYTLRFYFLHSRSVVAGEREREEEGKNIYQFILLFSM